MKTRLSLSLAALSLALVSCSNPANSDTPQPDLSTLAAPTTTSAAPKEPTKVEIGETITLTHGEEESQEVDLTIADIDASRQCHNGQSTSIDVPEESGYYVQMTGEVEAKKLQDTYRFSFADLTAKRQMATKSTSKLPMGAKTLMKPSKGTKTSQTRSARALRFRVS